MAKEEGKCPFFTNGLCKCPRLGAVETLVADANKGSDSVETLAELVRDLPSGTNKEIWLEKIKGGKEINGNELVVRCQVNGEKDTCDIQLGPGCVSFLNGLVGVG